MESVGSLSDGGSPAPDLRAIDRSRTCFVLLFTRGLVRLVWDGISGSVW